MSKLYNSYWQNLNFRALLAYSAVALLVGGCIPAKEAQANGKKARNIIFMVGDGMGLSQISAAFYANSQKLALEQFPHVGFHKTPSSNDLITDSAAGATAFSCGVKTYNGAIGLTADSAACTTILEMARDEGFATGLIATSTIVHATPAAFAAHQPIRVFHDQIAADLAESGVDLLIGGGKRYFDRREEDERNLLEEMRKSGYFIATYLDFELADIVPSPASKFAYFAADKHPLTKEAGREYLPAAVRTGAAFLRSRSKNGFFLLVEGSQIDWGGHANDGNLIVNETLDFDDAIRIALNFARRDGETLVIVTADHESGGLALARSGSPQELEHQFTTNGHTAAMVPVFAFGPSAELFDGIYENTEIFFKMQRALGLGNSPALEP